MKIAFWNIGKELTSEKLELLGEAIKYLQPDIFTIAEGTTSKKNCQLIVGLFERLNYKVYYSPLFSESTDLKLGYSYKSNGLKIFIKNDAQFSCEVFEFEDQKEQGRIIKMQVNEKFKTSIVVFIHNVSKDGSRINSDDQTLFMNSLAAMVQYAITPNVKKSLPDNSKDRVFIMGDFNLEPWEGLLRNAKLLLTSYFKNRNNLDLRKADRLYFFNPLLKLLHDTSNQNLLGTYFGNKNGWALFDYILYPTTNATVEFDVITEFSSKHKLLDDNLNIVKDFMNFNLDHLPITAIIN